MKRVNLAIPLDIYDIYSKNAILQDKLTGTVMREFIEGFSNQLITVNEALELAQSEPEKALDKMAQLIGHETTEALQLQMHLVNKK